LSNLKIILIFLISGISVQTLANACPYEEGTAVFKARMLWALFNPAAQYNDRLNCLPQTQNRSSNGTTNANNNIDSLLEAQVSEEATKIVEYSKFVAQKDSIKELVNLIQVYPNPATEYLYINYGIDKESNLYIYDQLGKIVLQKNIFNNEKIKLQDIANGIYHIKIILNNETYNAKLIIKK
jgi:hypothetical protein